MHRGTDDGDYACRRRRGARRGPSTADRSLSTRALCAGAWHDLWLRAGKLSAWLERRAVRTLSAPPTTACARARLLKREAIHAALPGEWRKPASKTSNEIGANTIFSP